MGYQGYAAASPLLVVLETACELILPLLMARIINQGIEGNNMTVIWQSGALMVAVALIATVVGGYAARCAAFAAQGLGANLRRRSLKKSRLSPSRTSTDSPLPPSSPASPTT